MHRRWTHNCILILCCMLMLGCQQSIAPVSTVVMDLVTPTPEPETLHLDTLAETPIPFPKVMPTPAPTPTPTPEPTPTPTPEPTPTPDATATPSAASKATATPGSTSKATATPKATATSKATAAPDSSAAKPTDTPYVTQAPTATPTATPSEVTSGTVLIPDGFTVSANAKFSAEEVVLAAKTAYFEARGKGEAAYRAVICVILNRVESDRYGGGFTSVRTEVYRKSQFSVVKRSDFETTIPPMDIIGYANDVLNENNRSIPEGVLFFRSERTDKTWGTKVFYETIGGNDFYYGG